MLVSSHSGGAGTDVLAGLAVSMRDAAFVFAIFIAFVYDLATTVCARVLSLFSLFIQRNVSHAHTCRHKTPTTKTNFNRYKQ